MASVLNLQPDRDPRNGLLRSIPSHDSIIDEIDRVCVDSTDSMKNVTIYNASSFESVRNADGSFTVNVRDKGAAEASLMLHDLLTFTEELVYMRLMLRQLVYELSPVGEFLAAKQGKTAEDPMDFIALGRYLKGLVLKEMHNEEQP